jgi:hypothetical protein
MIDSVPQQGDFEPQFLEPFEDKTGMLDGVATFFSDDMDGGKLTDGFEMFR